MLRGNLQLWLSFLKVSFEERHAGKRSRETHIKTADEYLLKHKALLMMKTLSPFSHTVRGKPKWKVCERLLFVEMWN